MNLWLVTNIRLRKGQRLPASSIQNIQTAMAMADQGHRVLMWVAALDACGLDMIETLFDRRLPQGLKLIPFNPKGREGDKKTPFSNLWESFLNLTRARLRAPAPEAVISRSPLLLEQLRAISMTLGHPRLILEYQYPEWAQLWRGWRKKHPDAGLDACRHEHNRLRRAESRRLAAADGIMHAACAHERLLRQAGYEGATCRLPSGCLTPAPEPADENVKYDLGYVGSLAPENGLALLLRSLVDCPGVSLVLIGGGSREYCDRLEALSAQLGLEERVTFLGPVPFVEIRGHMQHCRLGIVPISARCGPEKRQYASPLKLIEWMAAGVPVIATTVPSVVQQVTHGCQAWLTPPDDLKALVAAIQLLLGDARLRNALTKAGLSLATELTYPQRAQRIISFIEGISGPGR